jgi:helicase required for RNAi-mediated heterochromatin assembly 1
VVVLSCVRCNGSGAIGFLSNRNRLCVALSRARERLVVLGSAATLRSDPVWHALHAAAAQDPHC